MGDGPDADQFKSKAAHNNRISFIGHQNDPLRIMQQSNIFIHPSYHEGFSVALVEASMLSMPIIATSVGGNIEIIHHNETGLLVDAKNDTMLYDAMKKLLDDKNLRDKLGRNARSQYEKLYDLDVIVVKNFIPLFER